LGDWATHVRALATPAIVLADDHSAEAGPLNDLAATAAEAHGLREQVGWADYRRGEFGLVSGRWDEAVSAALRAVDLAEANAYVRLGVRSYFVLVAIAAQRGDVALGERCRRFNDALPGPKPDSPYARVMLAAQDLFLADLGLREPLVPDAEARIPAYGPTPMGLGSFLTATLRIADAWLDHDLEAANRIVPAILESGAQQSATELARATADLVRAKWLHADGESNATVEVAARSALERSRKVAAPWWIARSIDSLASIGRAEAALIEEARAIRRELGIATG
jgi:hypothetical protein